MSNADSDIQMKESRSTIRIAWLVVWLLWLVGVFNYFDRQLIITMGEPIMRTFQVDTQGFGLLSSLYLWVYAFFSPFAGHLADRIGYARTLTWSLLLWSIITLSMGLISSFEAMLFLRGLLAVFQSFAIPAGAALIVSYFPSTIRAFPLAVYFSGSMFGLMLCSTGGWISQWANWKTSFLASGAVGSIYAVFLLFFLHDRRQSDNEQKKTTEVHTNDVWMELLKSPRFYLLFLINAVFGLGSWTLTFWLPYYFHAEQNLSLTLAGFHGVLTINVSTFAGMFVFSRLSDCLSQRSPRFRAYIPACALLVSAPFLLCIGWNNSFLFLFLILLVIGFAKGAIDPSLMPLLCIISQPKNRALGYGLLNFGATFFGGCAIYGIGWLKKREISLSFSFQIAAVLFFLAGLLFLLFSKNLSKHDN